VSSVLALLVGVLGTWLGGIFLLRVPGPVAQPVPDRWHRKATPLTGGLALLVGFLFALSVTVVEHDADRRFGYVALGATAAFLLGLCDDERWIGPRAKFGAQFAIAASSSCLVLETVPGEPSRVHVADWRSKAKLPRVAR
jgi:UDP-N-acetylmuramyl pentapeptide phosphotransferase/UDP-N-acetylglucosamine-1-phosphate transferase